MGMVAHDNGKDDFDIESCTDPTQQVVSILSNLLVEDEFFPCRSLGCMVDTSVLVRSHPFGLNESIRFMSHQFIEIQHVRLLTFFYLPIYLKVAFSIHTSENFLDPCVIRAPRKPRAVHESRAPHKPHKTHAPHGTLQLHVCIPLC